MLFFDSDITVSAYNQDTESWRLNRIHRVIGFVCALDHLNIPNVLTKVAALEDSKGTLTVTWRHAPSETEKGYFKAAWLSHIGDGADNVEHVRA